MSDYPERLLPHPNYNIVEEKVLMSQKGLWLIRHIDSDKTKFIENTRTLNPDCIKIQSDHLRDLSNNLIGVFCIEDIYYGIEKNVSHVYCDIWDGTTECVAPANEHFFKDKERGYYFIPVDNLLKSEVKYTNLSDGTVENFHFQILHTPTNCNYWHISIRVYNEDNIEVSTIDVSERKRGRIWKAVRDYLVIALVNTEIDPDYSELSNSIYCKS